VNIHESAENYLERILMLQQEKGVARSVDIAAQLGVSKPSVSVAMKQLRENGYITMDRGGAIALTQTGEAIAGRILRRHSLLSEILMAWGVEPETAHEDACKMEHDLSEQSFQAICRQAGRAASPGKKE